MITMIFLSILYSIAGAITAYWAWYLSDFEDSKYKIGNTPVWSVCLLILGFFFWPLFILSFIIWVFWMFFKTS